MSITIDVSIGIQASKEKVWDTVTNPQKVKEWVFGTNVEIDWRKGSPIMFRGEWNSQTHEDKGIIQEIKANELLQYTHFSSRTKQADAPENYEVIRFELAELPGGRTKFTITEENLPSTEARDKSIGLWNMALESLKQTAEK